MGTCVPLRSRALPKASSKVPAAASRGVEERFRATFERAAIGIAHVSMEGVLLRVNAKLCELLGRREKSLVGRAAREFSHPDDRDAIDAHIPKLLNGEIETLSLEKRYLHRAGRPVWVRLSLALVRRKSGKPDYLIAMFEEISAKRAAEQARDVSRSLLEAALDSTAEGVLVTGLDGRITAWNARFLELFGVSGEALAGRTVGEAFDALGPKLADAQAVLVRLDQRYADPTREVRDEIALADGRVLERHSVPQRSGSEVIGRVCTFQDITGRKRAERDLIDAKQRLQLAMEASGVSIWDTDLRTGRVYLSEGWAKLLGEPPGETQTTREALMALAHPDDLPAVVAASVAVMKGEAEHYSEEHRVRTRSGEWRWVRSGGRVIERDRDGRALRMAGTNVDITERKRAEEALRLSEDRLQYAVRGSGAGIWDWNAVEDRYYMSPRLKQMMGYEDAELPDRRDEFLSRIHREDRPRVDEALRSHFSERKPYEIEYRLQRRDGSYVWIRSVGQAVWDAGGRVLRFAGSTVDIDAQKSAEAKLAHLAHHDMLTGLPNRNLLLDRLPQLLSRASRNRSSVGIMLIDLDRFKLVNDTLGHTVGDQLLVEVAKRLQECTRGGDTVARLGGDEFAVLLPDMPDAQKARTVAQKVLDRLGMPMRLDGHEVFVNASIGITVFPDDSEDQDTLIRNADVAMYSAKEQGRANYLFFNAEMNRRTAQFLELESRLRQAQARNEFVLHYQPRIGIGSGRITGAEALLRWRPPGSEQLVGPLEFVPLLEETGMIVAVGEWVLGSAFEQVRRWQAQGLGAVPVTVNVSPRQFQRRELVPALRRLLAETGIAPKLIELEITETLVMMDTDYSVAAMQDINELGVPLAIDDFGTGYSSLAYLKRFAIDRLKIDRSFIRDLASDADDAAIITAVVAMAHKLGFGVVAEGVETREQIDFLRACGCDEYQGNLFSPAVPVERFEALLAAPLAPLARVV
ncbi:MAG: EAL domain-containing protein [Betaproteobacteria bacterium]|nr:MAG: EAL domain-containing protein [Betaproteobacteria bacterium]